MTCFCSCTMYNSQFSVPAFWFCFSAFLSAHKVSELNAEQGRLPQTSFNMKQYNAYDEEE